LVQTINGFLFGASGGSTLSFWHVDDVGSSFLPLCLPGFLCKKLRTREQGKPPNSIHTKINL
jgi:hypothetical protein